MNCTSKLLGANKHIIGILKECGKTVKEYRTKSAKKVWLVDGLGKILPKCRTCCRNLTRQ
jgi:hypothetical protein